MANKFPSTCYKCGKGVEAGAGVLEQVSYIQRRKWRVELAQNPAYRLPKYLVQHHCCVGVGAQNTHYVLNPLKGETDADL